MSGLLGHKPAWLQEALENDRKAAANESSSSASEGQFRATGADLPWRSTYEDFWHTYRVIRDPNVDEKVPDYKAAVKDLMEWLAKENSDIDLSKVQYGETKIFMAREVYAEIALMRQRLPF